MTTERVLTHHCRLCDRLYASPGAALACAIEDQAEDDKARRGSGRSSD